MTAALTSVGVAEQLLGATGHLRAERVRAGEEPPQVDDALPSVGSDRRGSALTALVQSRRARAGPWRLPCRAERVAGTAEHVARWPDKRPAAVDTRHGSRAWGSGCSGRSRCGPATGRLPLGAPKQRALLALLLLNANRVVPRDRLIAELWGESAARDRRQGGAGLRLAAAQAAAARDARHAAAGLRAPGRARVGRPPALRAAGGRGARRRSRTRGGACWRRRSRCGAGRRWPSSPRSRSRGSRRAGSRISGSRRSRSGSRPTSRSAGTRS